MANCAHGLTSLARLEVPGKLLSALAVPAFNVLPLASTTCLIRP